MPRKRVLIITQPYPPDPAATGKYMEDVAKQLAASGHHVEVFASRERLDDPSVKLSSHCEDENIRLRRLPFTAFGKRTVLLRLVGAVSFAMQCFARGLVTTRFDAVFVSTAPPTSPLVALLLARIRRARMVYWIHDMNPDQVVALGAMPANHPLVKLAYILNRVALSSADKVIALDEVMARRAIENGASPSKTITLPPWPHDDIMRPVPRSRDTFRSQHQCEDKFVVMYSGNIGHTQPLDTLLRTARVMITEPSVQFVIIGQGEKREEVANFIRTKQLTNVTLLPYQPAASVAEALSAADLHVVVTRDELVGIVHSCKLYSSLAINRPILSIGPLDCPVSVLVTANGLGWAVPTGDHEAARNVIRAAAEEPMADRDTRSESTERLHNSQLNKNVLCQALCAEIIGMQP